MDDDCWNWQLVEHYGRVAAKIHAIGQQDDLNRLPFLMQSPGSYESVAAVVAFAAENHDFASIAIVRKDVLGHGVPGIFH
jgi:hypothetical protein